MVSADALARADVLMVNSALLTAVTPVASALAALLMKLICVFALGGGCSRVLCCGVEQGVLWGSNVVCHVVRWSKVQLWE